MLFIQLGDDFRYVSMDEARKQFDNYEKLFTYMNQQSNWNVDVRFLRDALVVFLNEEKKRRRFFSGSIWNVE